jgi:hypothetical protein
LDLNLLFSNILFFIGILLIYFIFVCENVMLSNIVCSVGDNNQIGTNVNMEGHVHINDENSGKSWALAGAIVGVGGVVAKSIAKAPMPPLQKAGAVVVGAVIGGVAQKALDN